MKSVIGTLQLGGLAKGSWRRLSDAEVAALAPPNRSDAGKDPGLPGLR